MQPSNDRRPLVLVVDDHPDTADMLADLLDAVGGYRTAVAHAGDEALELAAKLRPAIVLLDIGLPRVSGIEVCSRLRESFGPDLKIIGITGWLNPEKLVQMTAAGFDAILAKPCSYEQLKAAIEEPPKGNTAHVPRPPHA